MGMKIELNYQGGNVNIPSEVLNRIDKASDIALKLIIILASDENARADFDSAAGKIAKKLKCTRTDLDMALAFWCGAGVADISRDSAPDADSAAAAKNAENGPVSKEDMPQDSGKRTKKLMRAAGLPEYTSEELGDMLEKNSGTLRLVDESQRRIGRMFNPREVSILVGIKNYLELDDEYIYVLLDHCKRIGKTSIRYFETMAFGMYDENVADVESLEQKLREREEYAAAEGKFKAMIGARGRRLTTKETRFLNRWTVEMKYDFTMIGLSYEITVDMQHEYNPAYMNGILERWYAENITTPEQVKKQAEERKKGRKNSEGGSFVTEDFFEAALRRSYSEK